MKAGTKPCTCAWMGPCGLVIKRVAGHGQGALYPSEGGGCGSHAVNRSETRCLMFGFSTMVAWNGSKGSCLACFEVWHLSLQALGLQRLQSLDLILSDVLRSHCSAGHVTKFLGPLLASASPLGMTPRARTCPPTAEVVRLPMFLNSAEKLQRYLALGLELAGRDRWGVNHAVEA